MRQVYNNSLHHNTFFNSFKQTTAEYLQSSISTLEDTFRTANIQHCLNTDDIISSRTATDEKILYENLKTTEPKAPPPNKSQPPSRSQKQDDSPSYDSLNDIQKQVVDTVLSWYQKNNLAKL
jgi:hypothetical protein